MSRYQKFIGEIKYHIGWFLIASVIFAPVAQYWEFFHKFLPSIFTDYFNFVNYYSKYVMSLGVIIVLWKWIKDWKMLMIIGALIIYLISYIGGGNI